MSFDTVWRSIYSDISILTNSMPIKKASCFVNSVFPTPVGPVNKNEHIGLSSLPIPALAVLIALTTESIALS